MERPEPAAIATEENEKKSTKAREESERMSERAVRTSMSTWEWGMVRLHVLFLVDPGQSDCTGALRSLKGECQMSIHLTRKRETEEDLDLPPYDTTWQLPSYLSCNLCRGHSRILVLVGHPCPRAELRQESSSVAVL